MLASLDSRNRLSLYHLSLITYHFLSVGETRRLSIARMTAPQGSERSHLIALCDSELVDRTLAQALCLVALHAVNGAAYLLAAGLLLPRRLLLPASWL